MKTTRANKKILRHSDNKPQEHKKSRINLMRNLILALALYKFEKTSVILEDAVGRSCLR